MNETRTNNPLSISERATFRKIYDQEMGYVWNCLRRLGVDERDLEDKTHDVFVTFFRKMDTYDPERPVRPWLGGIAARIALDHNRLAYKKKELLLDEVERAKDTRTPETELERADRQRIVAHALDHLDLKQRAVFVLHELEGHSIPEIAEMTTVPENTLYSRLRLARVKFTESIRKLKKQGGLS